MTQSRLAALWASLRGAEVPRDRIAAPLRVEVGSGSWREGPAVKPLAQAAPGRPAVPRGQAEAHRAIRLFSLATLLPLLLLIAGLLIGGPATGGALGFIAVLIWLLDRFAARAMPHMPEADEFPAADGLSLVLAAGHLLLLPLMVWALAGGVALSLGEGLALFAGFGLWLGQVSNSNAHELIHRADPKLRALGVALYTSIGYGHHASAHRLVHHRLVATEEDPNTARRGEGFYGFALRAWPQEFVAGRQMEDQLQEKLSRRRLHPYGLYLAGAAVAALVAWILGDLRGVMLWLGLSAYAQAQLLLSDYVQHYGLERARLGAERYEAVGPQHSWDAPHWASSALMLNAPRHADHHAHPARAYPALELPEGGLRLPYSLPFMAMIALVPPLWFRVMDGRLPPPAPPLLRL